MPYIYDFSKIKDIKTLDVSPFGWTVPLLVEYGRHSDPNIMAGLPVYFWRVKGTLHTFTILVSRLQYLSSGNYKKHFEDALETFREDYIEWKKSNFEADWQKEYRQQYSRFIIT